MTLRDLPHFQCDAVHAVGQWVRTFASPTEVGCSNPSRDRPKSLMKVITPPSNDDHYKRMPRVTVGVAR